MQKQSLHWPSVLLFSVFGFGVLTYLGGALIVVVSFASEAFSTSGQFPVRLNTGLGFLIESILVGMAAFISLRRFMNMESIDSSLQLVKTRWHLVAAFFLTCVLIGYGALNLDLGWFNYLVNPIFTILGVVLPIWAILGLGIFNLHIGPRWRAWAVFGVGMTLGPFLMILLEILFGVILILVWALIIASRPEMLGPLREFALQVQSLKEDPERMIALIFPYLLKPAVLGSIYLYISLLVPLTEELLKPLGVWLFARRINSPAQGFALGLISGAAYAIAESVGVSDQGGANGWALVVATRVGTSLLHITTTGLMGWAIVSAWKERRYVRLLLTYLASVGMHGLWNASAVTVSVFAIAITDSPNKSYTLIAILAGFFLLLLLITFITLLAAGNKLARDADHSLEASPPAA